MTTQTPHLPAPRLTEYIKNRPGGIWKTLVDPAIEYRHEFRRVYHDTEGVILADSPDIFVCAAMLCLDEFMRRTDITPKFSQNVFVEHAAEPGMVVKASAAGAFLLQSGLVRLDSLFIEGNAAKSQIWEAVNNMGIKNAINALTCFEIGKFQMCWVHYTNSVPHYNSAQGINDLQAHMTYGTAYEDWYPNAVLGLRRLHECATKI